MGFTTEYFLICLSRGNVIKYLEEGLVSGGIVVAYIPLFTGKIILDNLKRHRLLYRH